MNTAYYHLPGLFEFCALYRMFVPLFREHREYFTTGVRLDQSMVRRPTVCGAEGVSVSVILIHRRCWPGWRNTESPPD